MTSSRRPRSSTSAAKRGSSSSDSTIAGASPRSRIVSKSGTGEISRACLGGEIDRRQDVRGRLRAGDDHRVDGALTQTALRLGDRSERLRDPR